MVISVYLFLCHSHRCTGNKTVVEFALLAFNCLFIWIFRLMFTMYARSNDGKELKCNSWLTFFSWTSFKTMLFMVLNYFTNQEVCGMHNLPPITCWKFVQLTTCTVLVCKSTLYVICILDGNTFILKQKGLVSILIIQILFLNCFDFCATYQLLRLFEQ